MQKQILHRFIFSLVLLVFAGSMAYSQDYASTKEKIYIQTSHVFFKPGETIFFKLYLVKGEDQTPSGVSNIVYAELISPAGTVSNKLNLTIQDGYTEGSFDLTNQMPGGIYKIKAYTNWMQNENETSFFTKEITVQKVIAPRVLLKLDFPEKGYGAGDQVKANFSMRNLADQPIRDYECTFTVSIAGSVVSNGSFTTDAEGKADVIFSLPKQLLVNDGLLNITVDYNAFKESISRSIPIVSGKIDLQFMPEGGMLVNSVPSFVAFKALNEDGKAADIKGHIIDNKGNTVVDFNSYHFGMGKFSLTPEPGKSYKAVITSPGNIRQQFDLPTAVARGITMHIEKKDKKVELVLYATFSTDIKLKAVARNTTYYLSNISLQTGQNKITIDEKIFPAGITQFTVYTKNEAPLAERLVFMNEDQHLNVSVTPDKKKYQPREKVILTIKTLDDNGNPIPSNFSIAVVDDKLWTFADDKQDHILSWLLLTSELSGKVEEPQFYFKKEEPKSVPALDLLMLTHGYRYFDYIDYVVKENQLKFIPDKHNVISGTIVNAKKEPISAKVYLVHNVHSGKAIEIETGKDGLFFFSDLLPANSYVIFAQALSKNEQVTINVLQNGVGFDQHKAKEFKVSAKKAEPVEVIGVAARDEVPLAILAPVLNKPLQPLGLQQDDKQVGLQEAVVTTALGIKRLPKSIGYSTAVVNADQINAGGQLVNILQGKVAGLQVYNNANLFGDTKIVLRGLRSITGDNQPLYVLDGVPMSQISINTINPNDIENITVLKDAAATALFGSDAANGAIIIDSKKFRRETVRFNVGNHFWYTSQIVYAAGSPSTAIRKFYAPVYKEIETEERYDFRETIYWNPVVQTGNNGTASVEFFNSDASTSFRAIAEGIAYNGKLGRTESTYAVQSTLQIDAKIPPYLTVGDKANVPLVIANNSSSEEEFSITVSVPDGMTLSNYSAYVKVPADSSVLLLIPIEANKAISGLVKFSVSGQAGKETLSLPVSAAPKGFPVSLTYSGNQSADHLIDISKIIPGTLETRLKLFNKLEGQLLDGIESMLREPHGCFEQTSSSTYPNIFVLKYLKESGKANPEIQKKAMDYINTGYKRLIGFETKEKGFEWFGNTPPHEALTAYGLLEFTDMKEFISVDDKMMERTKKFLLERRDGKGSFQIKSSGYDQFASVPAKIANTYIVYALTEAGIGKEIKLEYDTAVKKALESKDGYQLAMMAIAANDMKDIGSYNQLMIQLATQKDSIISETSVVNSRDASLRVETNALYAQALMRASSPDISKIARVISKILGEKTYYGYGSTQATVMALKAIVEYSKLMGKVADDTPVRFMSNDMAVSPETIGNMLKEGSNRFSVIYPKKENNIPYNLEISYSTFTPPNSAKADLHIQTTLSASKAKMGETVRMDISVTNTKSILQPMAIAKLGIPAGLSAQPWQLKEIMEKNKAAYYEIFDNYLVFYWMGFAPDETKKISLDLKADVPGTYKGKASNTYLYYTPEYKHWNDGLTVEIR